MTNLFEIFSKKDHDRFAYVIFRHPSAKVSFNEPQRGRCSYTPVGHYDLSFCRPLGSVINITSGTPANYAGLPAYLSLSLSISTKSHNART